MTEPTAPETVEGRREEPLAEPTITVVDRAIASVLEQVPSSADAADFEARSGKLQPWAETAGPAGRNKRPLGELLAEFAERVAANPGARAGRPAAKHPALAFLEKFTPGARGRGGGDRAAAGQDEGDRGPSRRAGRRSRGRSPGITAPVTSVGTRPGQPGRVPAASVAGGGPPSQGTAPGEGAGRPRRRRRGRSGTGGASGGGGDTARQPRSGPPSGTPAGRTTPPRGPRPQAAAGSGADPSGSAAPPGGGPRRRRGGRGRGRGGAPSGGGGGGTGAG